MGFTCSCLGSRGVFLALLGWAGGGWAQDSAYDPPAGYYNGTAQPLASSLTSVLNGKIKGHSVICPLYTSDASDEKRGLYTGGWTNMTKIKIHRLSHLRINN